VADYSPARGSDKFLAARAVDAVEEMDKPDCDPAMLHRTYAQFPLINWAVSGWHGIYHRLLRPRLAALGSPSLLDIGSGGGDVPRMLARWAERDGLNLRITAIDPDSRAHSFAVSRRPLPRLDFRQAFSSELVAEGCRFDAVVSNHLLHHLSAPELSGLLADSEQLSGFTVHSDIIRSRPAYVLFAAGTLPFFHRSYIRRDGLTSIRRSYTPEELRTAVPENWRVMRDSRFRQLLVHDADA
jgi:2-polyprenyl-3-methyl-5-hydroxy-6-metoxy-1,4-benzoquinol methylase